MKIHDLALLVQGGLKNVEARVAEYLQSHSDEVFRTHDAKLLGELEYGEAAIVMALQSLCKKGRIGKREIQGQTFFGSHSAIDYLRRSLDVDQDELWARINANRERIKARVGNLDNQALLDEIRGGPLPE